MAMFKIFKSRICLGRKSVMSFLRRRRMGVRLSLVCCLALVGVLGLASCNAKDSANGNVGDDEDCFHLGPPLISVYFVPLDGISYEEAKRLSETFDTCFADKQWEPYVVSTLEHALSPNSCMNEAGTRLSAGKLRSWVDDKFKNAALRDIERNEYEHVDYFIIGVTDRDISTSAHGHKDYGVLGLSILGKGHAAVVSTYRLRRRRDLWKLATHEFCHGFYGCRHCKKDDPHCIMADAKGGNPRFEIKDSLCDECATICLIGD